MVVRDWSRETRFEEHGEMRERGVASLAHVVIGPGPAPGRPWGVLTATSATPGRFGDDAVHFVPAIANVVGSAIERRRTEDSMLHQALHDSLTGLANRRLFIDRLQHAFELRGHRKPWPSFSSTSIASSRSTTRSGMTRATAC